MLGHFVVDLLCTLATALRSDIERMCGMSSNVDAVLLNVEKQSDELEKLVDDHDVVVRYEVYLPVE